MTINEWEQSNIEVLTSREMGEWLSRRENRLLGKIRSEIEQMEINGHIRDVECFRAGINTALNVIDKYREEQTDAT